MGNHQIEIYSLNALADGQETTQRQISLAARPDDMTGKHQKEEQRKIPILQVLSREIIGGKVELKRRVLRSQEAGTGVKTPGRPSLLNEGIQQTLGDGCVHADGNSKPRGNFFYRAIIGMKPEKNTSQVTAFEEVVVMPMRWQQGKVSKLNNVEKKQFDPDG